MWSDAIKNFASKTTELAWNVQYQMADQSKSAQRDGQKLLGEYFMTIDGWSFCFHDASKLHGRMEKRKQHSNMDIHYARLMANMEIVNGFRCQLTM